MTDATQKADATTQLQTLRDEVAKQFSGFSVVASTSADSRIEDVGNAFRRLISILDEALEARRI